MLVNIPSMFNSIPSVLFDTRFMLISILSMVDMLFSIMSMLVSIP